MPSIPSPAGGVLASTLETSLPGGPTRVSVGGVGSVISDSVVCQSDDLDMTLGALAQQIRSSVASETRGGEILSPPSSRK